MTKVLLYSGGLDSYALRHIWMPDLCLYVSHNTTYSNVEIAKLDPKVAIVNFPGLEQFERFDKIIPLRNLFLVSIAAQYGERIALAATAGDRVRDKSQQFAANASEMLSYLMNDYWNCKPEAAYTVELPLKHLTKHQIIQAFIAQGGDPLELAQKSFSCYTPTRELKECGACKPCFRKWVAFKLNGIEIEPDARPYINHEILPQILAGTYGRADEEAEILEAIEYVQN